MISVNGCLENGSETEQKINWNWNELHSMDNRVEDFNVG